MCVYMYQHLTSQTFVRLANETTYLTGSDGQKISLKMLRCKARALPASYSYVPSQSFSTMIIILPRRGKLPLLFLIHVPCCVNCALTIMVPSKVRPHCEAVVLTERVKVCYSSMSLELTQKQSIQTHEKHASA